VVVTFAFVTAGKPAAARTARERPFAGVRPDVSRQVIAPAERSFADRTDERLLAGVDSEVASQLVGARESTGTVDGRADVRPKNTHSRQAICGASDRR